MTVPIGMLAAAIVADVARNLAEHPRRHRKPRKPVLAPQDARGPVQAHKVCNGTGILTARLAHPWANDGERHFVRCEGCQGTGYIDADGRGVQMRVERL